MEQYSIITYVAACLATVALVFVARHFRRRPTTRLNLPPGPQPWPIIGNLNLMGPLPHRSVHELSKQYGQIMRLKFGSKNIVLFSARRLDSYENIRVEEMDSLINEIHKLSGEEIVLKDLLGTLSLNVITRMVLGKKFLDVTEVVKSTVSGEEFKKMVYEWFLLNGVLNIGDWIPWIGFMDLQGYVKRMKKMSKKFDLFLQNELNEQDERRRLEAENFLERHGVKAFTLELLVGGTESSAVIVEWSIAHLLKKPEIFKTTTDELDKETLRLHPLTTMLAPRRTREDCNFCGYDIPKDTCIMVNVWTIGRDPTLWDKPEEFCPERFIGKEMDVNGNHFELLPFGAGRRMCPGYTLGLKVIESCLANLLHGFNWKLPSKMNGDDLEMDEIYGLSTHM
nr:cytochrome P450 71A1-like [Tanacetum cinerariifolium]